MSAIFIDEELLELFFGSITKAKTVNVSIRDKQEDFELMQSINKEQAIQIIQHLQSEFGLNKATI